MTWKKIGAAARKVTKQLQQPFAVVLRFSEPGWDEHGNNWTGIITFNRPSDWSPNDDEQQDIREVCEQAAGQIREDKLARGMGYFLWDGGQITAEMKRIGNRISASRDTLAAWCAGKYFVPIADVRTTHRASEMVQ